MISDIAYLFAPLPLGLLLLGTALGIMVGAVPGLTGAMLISLTLPWTFSMEGIDAMILLVSMYVGSVSGGLISATLLRMPGTPASIMTTLDGYPMARKGRPGRALGLGITASLVGGVVSWGFLVLLAKPVARLSTSFGPFEFFSLVLVALVLIASVSGPSLLKGMLAGFLGMLASLPGTAPATGELRLTLGFHELNDGLKLLPVLIGLFAINQAIQDILRDEGQVEPIPVDRTGMIMKWRDWQAHATNLARSSIIGTWVGILPGIGANIGSIMAYAAAKKLSPCPEQFGQGSEAGIVAAESANNATVGGALIPLIAMGIPGSVIDAILLGALVIHGLQPGPLLFDQHPEVVHTMMGTVLLANVFMFVFMVAGVGMFANLGRIPRAYLLPVIFTFCVVGSYALSNRMFDVWVMMCFALIGLGMERLAVPLAPFVIGFVLAPLAEENLSAGLMMHGGSWWPMFTQPVSLLFLTISMILLCWPICRRARDGFASSKSA